MKLFVPILLLFLTACASDPHYAVQKPFLYEVQKNDKKGYLFGTIHIGVADEDLPPEFWPYFEKSDVYAFETDVENVDESLKAIKDLTIRRDSDRKLAELMSPEDFSQLKSFLLRETPKDAENLLNYLTPFGATQVVEELKTSPDVQVGHGEYVRLTSKFMLDRALTKKAKSLNRTIVYLDAGTETALIQCVFGDQAYYLKKLKESLNQPEKVVALSEYRQKVDDYRSGDEAKMMSSDLPSTPSDKCLLEERNLLWMNNIVAMLENYQSPFIAVGVAHLVSPKGSVIELLTKRGFKVRRLNGSR